MDKELNKKLKLDSIDWVEVLKGLSGKTTFKDYDIKRALHKTGRHFNINAPFRGVCKKFIDALGETVSSKMVSGEIVYTLTSTEEAINILSKTKKTVTQAPLPIPVFSLVSKKEEETTTPVSDVDNIKGLFRRSSVLEKAITLLAVFVKYDKTELPSRIIKTELTDLGVNFETVATINKHTITEIYQRLGYKLTTGRGAKSTWKIEGNCDLLNEYTRLCEIYKTLTGKETRNLDDFITSEVSEKEVNRKYEEIKEKKELLKRAPREPREEKDPEVLWKKWLLILSSKNALGASRSVSGLVSWISNNRNYEITELEAKRFYHELSEDTENELAYNPIGGYVQMSEKAWKTLSKFYSPKKNFRETIYVKLPLSLEVVTHTFPGLKFKLDDTTTSGEYLYGVELNRGVECEISLKKLIRFIQIYGKIYTDGSWMVNRVTEIIQKEDSNEKSRNTILLSLEDKI